MTEHGQKLIDIAKENGKREMGTCIKNNLAISDKIVLTLLKVYKFDKG